MARGMIKCPVCGGSGRITEDSEMYEFVTREPGSTVCLTCNGRGEVGVRKILADGRKAVEIKEKDMRLNVSRKAGKVEEIDTGIGYKEDKVSVDTRLAKVLASGKRYLVVVDTEPYYIDVYRLIREQERQQGTWDIGDEVRYVAALEAEYDKIKEQNNG